MNKATQCAECERIIAEMRTAFLKLMATRPQGDLPARENLMQFLSALFSAEPDLTRLSKDKQGELGIARHKWMEHRIATGHVPDLLSAMN